MQHRIPAKFGLEQSAFAGYRPERPGLCAKAKKQYQRRLRREFKKEVLTRRDEGCI